MSQLMDDRARTIFDPRILTTPMPQPPSCFSLLKGTQGWQASGARVPFHVALPHSLVLYPAGDPSGPDHRGSAGTVRLYVGL